MKVIDVLLDHSKLLQLPEDERTLYFSLGHAANEINALAKNATESARAVAKLRTRLTGTRRDQGRIVV